jgi:hypothetical protein
VRLVAWRTAPETRRADVSWEDEIPPGAEDAGTDLPDDARWVTNCPDCTCCSQEGCHTGPDADCGYSTVLDRVTCPCTEPFD